MLFFLSLVAALRKNIFCNRYIIYFSLFISLIVALYRIVLAVFYFVGHGFEKNGKNYLLAVDAPNNDCRKVDCVSVEWILGIFEDSHPALNLILLDVCRKNMK